MDISPKEMEATRIARWGKVEPYGETFIESRMPGFNKRLYKLINRGVLENKGVQPAIHGEHRFGVSLIEIPVGQGANLHSHVTEEVFFPLNGRMIVIWGERGEPDRTQPVGLPVGARRSHAGLQEPERPHARCLLRSWRHRRRGWPHHVAPGRNQSRSGNWINFW